MKELKRDKKWRLTNDTPVVYFFLVFLLINVFFPLGIMYAMEQEVIHFIIGGVLVLGVLVMIRFFKTKAKYKIQSKFTSPQSSFTIVEEEIYGIIIMLSFFGNILLFYWWQNASLGFVYYAIVFLFGAVIMLSSKIKINSDSLKSKN